MKSLTPSQKKHREYIKSDEWAKVRADMLIAANFQCERCNKKKNLQVHHLTYERFGGDEIKDDLIVLCGYHHRLEHNLVYEKKKTKKKTYSTIEQLKKKKLRKYKKDMKKFKVKTISIEQYLTEKAQQESRAK